MNASLQLRDLPLLRRRYLAQVRAESLHRLGVHLDAGLLLVAADVHGQVGRPCLRQGVGSLLSKIKIQIEDESFDSYVLFCIIIVLILF